MMRVWNRNDEIIHMCVVSRSLEQDGMRTTSHQKRNVPYERDLSAFYQMHFTIGM